MVWITLCLDSSVNTVSVKVIWAMAFSLVCSFMLLCMHAQSLQSRPTLCDTLNCSPSGSSLHGILQARILTWVPTPSSGESSGPRECTCVSCGSCIAGRFFTAEPLGKPVPTLQILATIELPPESPLGPLFQLSFMQNKPPQKLGP